MFYFTALCSRFGLWERPKLRRHSAGIGWRNESGTSGTLHGCSPVRIRGPRQRSSAPVPQRPVHDVSERKRRRRTRCVLRRKCTSQEQNQFGTENSHSRHSQKNKTRDQNKQKQFLCCFWTDSWRILSWSEQIKNSVWSFLVCVRWPRQMWTVTQNHMDGGSTR